MAENLARECQTSRLWCYCLPFSFLLVTLFPLVTGVAFSARFDVLQYVAIKENIAFHRKTELLRTDHLSRINPVCSGKFWCLKKWHSFMMNKYSCVSPAMIWRRFSGIISLWVEASICSICLCHQLKTVGNSRGRNFLFVLAFFWSKELPCGLPCEGKIEVVPLTVFRRKSFVTQHFRFRRTFPRNCLDRL